MTGNEMSIRNTKRLKQDKSFIAASSLCPFVISTPLLGTDLYTLQPISPLLMTGALQCISKNCTIDPRDRFRGFRGFLPEMPTKMGTKCPERMVQRTGCPIRHNYGPGLPWEQGEREEWWSNSMSPDVDFDLRERLYKDYIDYLMHRNRREL